jgi:two-component system CheB/CheR fusion protein
MTAFLHGGKQTCELRIQRSDGAVFTVCLDSLLVESVNTEPTLRITLTDITERRQALAQQYAANERLQRFSAEQAMHLRELASELTHAEQRERDLLYEQLHDEVQPLLVAARLSLSSLSVRTPPEDRLYIASEACVHISKVLQVTRSLSLQLSPPLIRERGLNPALEFLCRWVKSYHGLEVELTGAPEAEPGEVALRLVCFSAVRELLMNVAKHAGTAHATLTLQLVDQDTLHITVTDRGNGFDPAIITNGSGLSGLERRLGMFGGGLQIDSKPGHGTVATLSVPLRETTPAGWMLRSPEPRRKTREYDAQDTDC